MLDNGFKYETQLKEMFKDTWYDDKYKFYRGSFNTDISFGDNDEYCRWFVSIHKGNIIGAITYSIDIHANSIWELGAINFSDNIAVFGKDLAQVIDDIFVKFNHNRLGFCVTCGNPVEESYDRLMLQLGGRIVGERIEAIYIDGYLYDEKEYELLREDYLKHRYIIVGKKRFKQENIV